MTKKRKKEVRRLFRKEVFVRDQFKCVKCGLKDQKLTSNPEQFNYKSELLDAHHITPREEMPNGGYVKENGITLCKEKCHLLAEKALGDTDNPVAKWFDTHKAWWPKVLYEKVGSTLEKAQKASENLK